MAGWLLAWNASLNRSVSKKAFGCSMRRIRPIGGLHKQMSFQITAAISCTTAKLIDGYALVNRLATAVSSKVGKCWKKFWVVYGISRCVIGYDLALWR
jgi:hypothetical protein